ncbi:MAG: histidine phosphatase family protein [Variovorax sp.]|nr:MAG: histidine phosphatase family protein [Variovorax sp.]
MDVTRLIAIRHGETAWNVDTRIQGQLDIPLNPTGQWQARRLGEALRDEPIAAVYSSDLRRASQTAATVAGLHGIEVHHHVGLRERGFGQFEGMTFAQIDAELPEQARLWRTRDPDFSPSGGESLIVFRRRIVETIDALAARHVGQLIAIVAHGGVLDLLYRLATWQELQAPRTWNLQNATINRLLWTPQGLSLVGWGDNAHLTGDPLDEFSA